VLASRKGSLWAFIVSGKTSKGVKEWPQRPNPKAIGGISLVRLTTFPLLIYTAVGAKFHKAPIPFPNATLLKEARGMGSSQGNEA